MSNALVSKVAGAYVLPVNIFYFNNCLLRGKLYHVAADAGFRYSPQIHSLNDPIKFKYLKCI